jgi:hypothetical protein
MQIGHTTNRHEKNEIFVDTIASTIVGTFGSYLVGLFLISNPAGWGMTLVYAAGVAAVAYASGKAAKIGYNTFGGRVDFVSGAGLDAICH